MKNNENDFEEVDKHIRAGLAEAENVAGAVAAVSFAQVCGPYKLVRPILQLITNAFFIPQPWKQAIRIFVNVMDALCP